MYGLALEKEMEAATKRGPHRAKIGRARSGAGSIIDVKGPTTVHQFELRGIEGALELSGGRLVAPLVFPQSEPERPLRLVGFFAREEGGVLRIFDRDGKLIKERRFEAAGPPAEAVGGLAGGKNDDVIPAVLGKGSRLDEAGAGEIDLT